MVSVLGSTLNVVENDRSGVSPAEQFTFLILRVDPLTQVAIDLGSVQEVFTISMDVLTFMPNMAAFVLGLIHHRNQLVWVVDLGKFLGLLSQRSTMTEYAVAIVFTQDTPIAFLVQNIGGLLRVSPDQVRSIPDLLRPSETVSACAQGFVGEVNDPLLLLKGDALIKTLLHLVQTHAQTHY